jgi:uncharacterized protein YyaL (SSP411 family)
MVEQTLLKMRGGGIYDQLGYGFHRYSTDEKWLVPHFEKMLYDQAGLVLAYLDAWQVTGHEVYAATVREIITYLERNMTAAEGAFFSAEDADSEGVEGKFYLWSEEQIRALLSADAESFSALYNVTGTGNYLDEVTGKVTGKNILHLSPRSAEDFAGTVLHEHLDASRQSLFAAREQRVRPHLDDKIITAWNGMMISALSEAGRAFGDKGYVEKANGVADFILKVMCDKDGRLLRRYRQGESAVSAFAEDYAFLVRGLLDLYAVDFDVQRLAQALELASTLRHFFQDPVTGRLYDTASDGEKLLIRPSSTFDGATPSASSIALDIFARLFLLTGDSVWRVSSERLLQSLSSELSRYPAGYTQLLQSANWFLQPTREVVIVGPQGKPSTEAMLSVAGSARLQQTVVLFKPESDSELVTGLSPFIKSMRAVDGHATAYVCQNFSCREPLTDAKELQRILNSLPDGPE